MASKSPMYKCFNFFTHLSCNGLDSRNPGAKFNVLETIDYLLRISWMLEEFLHDAVVASVIL